MIGQRRAGSGCIAEGHDELTSVAEAPDFTCSRDAVLSPPRLTYLSLSALRRSTRRCKSSSFIYRSSQEQVVSSKLSASPTLLLPPFSLTDDSIAARSSISHADAEPPFRLLSGSRVPRRLAPVESTWAAGLSLLSSSPCSGGSPPLLPSSRPLRRLQPDQRKELVRVMQ